MSQYREWWAPFRSGFFLDAKHRTRMGNAVWLYGYCHMYADRQTGKLNRKVKTIANEIDVPVRTVESWFQILRRGGYVKTQRLYQSLAIQILKWRPLNRKNQTAESCGLDEEATAKSAGVTRKIHGSNPQKPALTAETCGILNNAKQKEKADLTAEYGGNKKSLLKESIKKINRDDSFFDTEAEKKWNSVKQALSQKIIPENFNTWFAPTIGLIIQPNKVVVKVPNRFYKQCLEENYQLKIREALLETAGFEQPPKPEFIIRAENEQ